MTINNVELNIDFTDAETLDRIESGSKKVFEEAEKLKQEKGNMTLAEGIRQECKIIKEFLDYVVGDSISEKIFGKRNSLSECLQVFEDIIEIRNKELSDFQEKISKYSPDRLKR